MHKHCTVARTYTTMKNNTKTVKQVNLTSPGLLL